MRQNLPLGSRGTSLSSLVRGNTIFPSESQKTTLSTFSLSPIPSISSRPLEEIPECEEPETDLNLIETPSVFSDETSHSVVWLIRIVRFWSEMYLKLISIEIAMFSEGMIIIDYCFRNTYIHIDIGNIIKSMSWLLMLVRNGPPGPLP